MPLSITRRALLVTPACVPAAWTQSWAKKQFPNWSRKDIVKLLTDSPWAKSEIRTCTLVERGARQGGGRPPRMGQGMPGSMGRIDPDSEVEASINVRWSSSLPIRQATALYKYGKGGLDSDSAKSILARNPDFYVLDVAGLPAAVANWGTEYVRIDFDESAALLTATKRRIRPNKIDVKVGGTTVTVTLLFAREKPIRLADKEVEFTAKINTIAIRRKFRLKSMVYNGRLEL